MTAPGPHPPPGGGTAASPPGTATPQSSDVSAVDGLAAVMTPLVELRGLLGFGVLDATTGTTLMTRRLTTEPLPLIDLSALGEAASAFHTLAGKVARAASASEVEDAVVTLSGHQVVIRQVATGGRGPLLVVLVLDRAGTNLAMALRVLRHLPLALPELGLPIRVTDRPPVEQRGGA